MHPVLFGYICLQSLKIAVFSEFILILYHGRGVWYNLDILFEKKSGTEGKEDYGRLKTYCFQ